MIQLFTLILSFFSPTSHEVTVGEFDQFVKATGYKTTAEIEGWSFVARSVQKFDAIKSAYWLKPDGINEAPDNHPVTQVSWYDAVAYCQWRGVELYTIKDWKASAEWKNPNISGKILSQTKAWNGNVWEWTKEGAAIGGSYLCSVNTCAGYTEGKAVHWPGKDAGSNNIGFRVKN